LQIGFEDLLGIKQRFDVHLPDPSTFTYGPIEDLGALDTFSVSSSAESTAIPETLDEDIWAFPNSDVKAQTLFGFKSWERFYDKSFQEPRGLYISEGGSRAFDAALAAQPRYDADGKGSQIPGHVVQLGSLLTSLMQLGLGWESVLYRYSEDNRSFYPLIEDGRPSGYSPEAFKSLSSTFIDHGNKTIQLRNFIQKIQASTSSPASLVALASSFFDVLGRLHTHLGDSATTERSLLRLQSIFERPGLILSSLSDVVAKIQDAVTDEEILSRLYAFIQDTENTAPWLRPTIYLIFAAASKPWLESVSGWLGLETGLSVQLQHQYHLPGFVKLNEESCKVEGMTELKELEYQYEPFSMPSFITEEDARLIFETGRSLRLLQAHQPDHPLLEPSATHGVETPGLAWKFSWEDIQSIQTHAQEYGMALQIAIRDFDLQGTTRTSEQHKCKSPNQTETETKTETTSSEEVARAYISASISAIEKPLTKSSTTEEHTLSELSLFDIDDVPMETFAPPMSLVPMLSFNPLISTQAHLTNRACLRLLFKHHDLRAHFTLLHRYSLFGDGVFTSQLSHALFDPELQSAERRKGHSRAGTSGLKLGSRDSWPPASSELRLALMGILTDSYRRTRQFGWSSSTFRNDLPGGLSFSIREMAEAELQRCMNPDSIEALDFLKLEYKPPSPLDTVITSTSLLKYDAVFKLLLRAVRMLFVVNQLLRDTKAWSEARPRRVDPLAQSFRIESHHFISAICAYFFDGIQANWAKLVARLEDVEKGLDGDGTGSVPNLRDFHDAVLDRMMFALILRKRQAQVMKLLEEIFSLVLQFAKHMRLQNVPFGEAQGAASSAELGTMYEHFKKKVRVFVSVCRGLRERRGQGGTSAQDTLPEFSGNGETDEDGGNTIGQLLLKLEMSGFYPR